jgi:DNA replication protein DnaC
MSSPDKSSRRPWKSVLDRIASDESWDRRVDDCREKERLEDKERRIANAWADSGVGRRFAAARLDTYDTPTTAHVNALRSCRQAVEQLDKGDGILLLGEPEGGKTHLLAGMLHAAIANGLTARYITAEDFYLGLRACMDGKGQTESAYLISLANPDVLALDDIYTLAIAKSGGEESYQYRMLWTLLDRRYREAKATLASTNRSLDQFRDILDSRTRRRLEAKVVLVPRRTGL